MARTTTTDVALMKVKHRVRALRGGRPDESVLHKGSITTEFRCGAAPMTRKIRTGRKNVGLDCELVNSMETSLSEALVRLMKTEFPQQQSVRPELAPGTPAPTSQRSDSVIDSTTQREGSDSITNRADEPRLVRPMELAQPLSPSFGRRFAALLLLIAGVAAVLAIAGVSVYVLVYPPADEKLATTTAPSL